MSGNKKAPVFTDAFLKEPETTVVLDRMVLEEC